jgi:hypothetical protein
MFLIRDEKDVFVKFEEKVRHDRMERHGEEGFIQRKIEKNKEKI